ncbi:MAG TPA: GNAT family N-acetyltransferase [Polyangia bacterium]|nr:GNAT family N-acetyltransferase [Polyangia bacterium]
MGAYLVTTDPARIDRDLVYGFLVESYWSKGLPRAVFERALANALCFSALDGAPGAQVGFARVVTDRATFAYLADVFVVPAHRGRGVSKSMMAAIVAHPELQGLRRWVLATRDAHGLYAQYGFTPLHQPDRFMERWDPDVYRR